MRKIQDLILYELFWIPIIIGAGIAWLYLSFTGAEQSVLGYGSLVDNLIAIVLIFLGAWILIRMPGNFLRYLIGLSLLGFGLYLIIMGMV